MKRKQGTWGHGLEILLELLQLTFFKSGLKDRLAAVYLSLLGSDRDIHEAIHKIIPFNQSGKIHILLTANNIYLSEIPTIYAIDRLSPHFPPSSKILYAHTKGVRKNGISNYFDDWRRYMSFYLIEHYELCFEAIDRLKYDSCGVLKQRRIYAGNFWWASSAYLSRRRRLSVYRPLSELKWDMGNRYEAEEFLLKYSTPGEEGCLLACIYLMT